MNKKQMLILLLMAAVFISCAKKPLYLVNVSGDRESCIPSSREGVIGKILPNQVSTQCKDTLIEIGYLPESEAGMIDITLEMKSGGIVALSLPDEAFQQQPDLENGDRILSIDGQNVTTVQDGRSMLFGTVASTASIIFARGAMEFPVHLVRQPMQNSSVIPKVVPLVTADSYSDNAHVVTTDKKPVPKFLQIIQHLFLKKPEKDALPTSLVDHYSQVKLPMKKSDLKVSGVVNSPGVAPLDHDSTLPPLMIVGDQVCRARQHFMDVGRVEDQRGDRFLIAIDHIQLIRAPYTEFHHFGQESLWSPIKDWQPCFGDAPLFLQLAPN